MRISLEILRPLKTVLAVGLCLSLTNAIHAQTGAASSRQEQQHHHESAAIAVEFPRLGRAQMSNRALFSLEQALHTAQENNPTYKQAEAAIRTAHGRAQQAGLYPNPIVGYAGDEIRGGEIHGGKQGFFVEQTIVTGGKLARAKAVMHQDQKLAEIEAEEQKQRVETAVKMAFYRVLAAQEMADSRADLARIAEQTLETQKRLQNTGQADQTEILAAEVEAQRMRLAARMKENTLREEWRSLAAVVGQPELLLQTVAGDLEHGWPTLEESQTVDTIATHSPAARIASASGDHA